MKKLLLFLMCAFTQITSVEAFDVEARVAYFIPEDDRLRKIYGKNGFAEYEIEASMPMSCCCECACDWDYFFNVAYYEKKGRSSCLHNKTKIEDLAFNLGVRRYFDICECMRPYLGLGAGVVGVRFHDHSPFVKQRTEKWGASLLVKSGVRYDITCNIFVDLFADYCYHWFNFHNNKCLATRNVNTGGFKIGVGLGYGF